MEYSLYIHMPILEHANSVYLTHAHTTLLCKPGDSRGLAGNNIKNSASL